jgi:hypothetical protein
MRNLHFAMCHNRYLLKRHDRTVPVIEVQVFREAVSTHFETRKAGSNAS